MQAIEFESPSGSPKQQREIYLQFGKCTVFEVSRSFLKISYFRVALYNYSFSCNRIN